jgi:hypothetical protein
MRVLHSSIPIPGYTPEPLDLFWLTTTLPTDLYVPLLERGTLTEGEAAEHLQPIVLGGLVFVLGVGVTLLAFGVMVL